jgi:hypothetical protein
MDGYWTLKLFQESLTEGKHVLLANAFYFSRNKNHFSIGSDGVFRSLYIYIYTHGVI